MASFEALQEPMVKGADCILGSSLSQTSHFQFFVAFVFFCSETSPDPSVFGKKWLS
jgi:hypothetical protein